jgi:hypothetical protein
MDLQLELLAKQNYIDYADLVDALQKLVFKKEKSKITFIDLELNEICLENGKKINIKGIC